ncbi:MAG: NADH-quinone oxidoreductase subunit NuoH [Verrucomicrobiaceae bacterium]|nr:NADH-quinone oxidoreductase subunit NuoH [Verrucomicrobiaceae bacterium]
MTLVERIDQAPLLLQRWAVSFFPALLQPWVAMLISAAAIIGVFASLFALSTLAERKGLGRIQNRPGPNRVGPFGMLQPLADGIKMLIKEDIVPLRADKVLHFLAPIALIVPSLLVYSVLPIGRNLIAMQCQLGVLLFFAIGASTELSIFMAGWGSHNKYSLLGSIRAIAQMISYELPMVLAAVTVILATSSLDTVNIVEAQAGGFWAWHAFTPWGAIALLTFFICALAESNRAPFDLPEAESELIAGHLTEYSGFKYALFFMAEYLGMMAISGMAITLFLGGWQAPLPILNFIPSWMWFFGKLACFVVLFIWIRGTLPRLRADQLMNLAWKFLLPIALLNIGLAGLWVKSSGWIAWPISVILLGLAIVGLGRLLRGSRPRGGKRIYRYAD